MRSLYTHVNGSGIQDYPSSYNCAVLTLAQQYNVLSSLSNYPYREHLNCFNKVSKLGGDNSRISIHRSFCNPSDQNPASIRNRFIYFWVNGNFDYCDRLLCFYYDDDFVVEDVIYEDVHDDSINNDELFVADTKRNPQLEQQSSRLGESEYTNMCQEETPYEAFQSQITSNVFRWREHSDSDIICMNDYDITTGILLSNQFVHVKRHFQLNGIVSFSCSCKAYKTAVAHSSYETTNRYSCSHCLYMQELVEPHISNVPDILQKEVEDTDNFVQKMIKNSALSINKEVLYLPPITKSNNRYVFSILVLQNCSMCYLSGDFLICGETSCKEHNRNKRKVCTLMKDGATACIHLLCMKQNYDEWSCYVNVENNKERNDHAKVW